MSITVVPIDAPLGAEIRGLDPHREIDDETKAQMVDAWHRYQVLLVRGLEITEEEQIRLGSCFGRLWKTDSDPKFRKHVKHAEMILITNQKENGEFIGTLAEGDMTFHQDNIFRPVPAVGSILYAVAIPSTGGETMFANMYAAYEALPAATKRKLEGVRAIHTYNYSTQHRDANKKGEAGHHGVAGGASHPAVIVHPGTGRKALYLNRLMTMALEGLPEAEGDALLEELFDHCEQPQFVYEHSWRKGDMLLWDNWCTMHARKDWPVNELRLMRRLTVESDFAPAAAAYA